MVKLVLWKDTGNLCHSTDARALEGLCLLTVFSVHEGGDWTLPVGACPRTGEWTQSTHGPCQEGCVCVCVGFCYSRILSTFIPPWCIQATMTQWIPQDLMLSLNTSLLISVHLFIVEFQLCSCCQILKTNWGLAESIPKDMRGCREVPSQQETKTDLLREVWTSHST